MTRISDVQLTAQGRREREADLAELMAKRPEVASRLGEARAGGNDPAENLDLRDAMDDLALLEGRIGEMRALLAAAEIVDESPAQDGSIRLGTKVRVRHADGEEADYLLVSAAEADTRRGRISVESPIGQALLGRRSGERTAAETPNGQEQLEVLKVG